MSMWEECKFLINLIVLIIVALFLGKCLLIVFLNIDIEVHSKNKIIAPANHFLFDGFYYNCSTLKINEENLSFGLIDATNSMLPTFGAGHYTIEKFISNNTVIRIGDIITYKKKDLVIIHRVNDIYSKDGIIYYVPKGDNNIIVDEPINRSQIETIVMGVLY